MHEPLAPYGNCATCEQPLLQPRGFYDSDLCGPCCTGNGSTFGQITLLCRHYVAGCAGALEIEREAWNPGHHPCPVCRKQCSPTGFPVPFDAADPVKWMADPRSKDGARIAYDPAWSRGKPWKVYASGTACGIHATVQLAHLELGRPAMFATVPFSPRPVRVL